MLVHLQSVVFYACTLYTHACRYTTINSVANASEHAIYQLLERNMAFERLKYKRNVQKKQKKNNINGSTSMSGDADSSDKALSSSTDTACGVQYTKERSMSQCIHDKLLRRTARSIIDSAVTLSSFR